MIEFKVHSPQHYHLIYIGTMIDIMYQSLKLVLCSGTHALF